MADFKGMAEALIVGDANTVSKLVQEAVDEGVDAKKILDDGLIPGMDVVGVKFKNGEIYVPEVLVSARAMTAGMKILEPILTRTGAKPKGTIVIGTVRGDLHDIGKNLVAMMLKGAGWKIIDLGVDVDPEVFVETAMEKGADVLGMSALLTTTMINMRSVVEVAKEKGGKFKIVIGGAPITQDYADEIGADGYAPDAASAVELMNSFVA